MGFFKSIGNFFSDAVKSVVRDPIRAVTLATGIGALVEGTSSAIGGRTGAQIRTGSRLVAGAALSAFAPVVVAGLGAVQLGGRLTSRPGTVSQPRLQALSESTYRTGQVGYPPRPITNITSRQGVQPMALDLGSIFSTVGNLFGGVSANPYVQGAGQILSSLAPAFTPAQSYGPIYSPQVMQAPYPARPVMAMGPVIASGASAIATMTAPILFRISQTLGRRVSLAHAITIIRKMGKMLMNPAAIGTALGISLGELATLITAHSSKKSRRMNPANGKALRRAARRIKGFHKMCGTIDLLKSRSRRSPVRTVAACR